MNMNYKDKNYDTDNLIIGKSGEDNEYDTENVNDKQKR